MHKNTLQRNNYAVIGAPQSAFFSPEMLAMYDRQKRLVKESLGNSKKSTTRAITARSPRNTRLLRMMMR
jgi:hypothetical protein